MRFDARALVLSALLLSAPVFSRQVGAEEVQGYDSGLRLLSSASMGHLRQRGLELFAANKLDRMTTRFELGVERYLRQRNWYDVRLEGGATVTLFEDQFGRAGLWAAGEYGVNWRRLRVFGRAGYHLELLRSTASRNNCFSPSGADQPCDPDDFDPGTELQVLSPITFGASAAAGASVELVPRHLSLGLEGTCKGWVGPSQLALASGSFAFVFGYDLGAQAVLRVRF